ncbi:MAG TPA: hypothetical protein VII45_08910 [Solirubrobacterales bacterium]
MDRDFLRQVQANVVAGLIVAGVLLIVGAIYTFLRSLSLSDFASYIAFPAAGIGVVVGGYLVVRSTLSFIARLEDRQAESDAEAERLEATLAKLKVQSAGAAYVPVILAAKKEGWKHEWTGVGELRFTRGNEVVTTEAGENDGRKLPARLGLVDWA